MEALTESNPSGRLRGGGVCTLLRACIVEAIMKESTMCGNRFQWFKLSNIQRNILLHIYTQTKCMRGSKCGGYGKILSERGYMGLWWELEHDGEQS
jgi:hypothetical protein